MEEKEIKVQPEKMSYEQLENIAHQLSEQNRQLYMQMRGMSDTFKRLDYLFKVLETKESFTPDFIIKCSEEIVDLMAIQDEQKEETLNTEQ